MLVDNSEKSQKSRVHKAYFFIDRKFSRNAFQNFRNNHLWPEENTHAIAKINIQFSVNVWAGNFHIEPVLLYFIEFQLPGLLENSPLLYRNQ